MLMLFNFIGVKIMTHSAKLRLNRVLENGQIIALLDGHNGFTGRLYRTSESRGYKTNFSYKHFFYLVTFKNSVPSGIEGVTRDVRRKNILKHAKQQGIEVNILQPDVFAQWQN